MTYNKEIQDRLKTNEIKVNPYRLYVGKWDGIWDQDEFCKIREKITKSFKDLVFDEAPHKYYLNGEEITCVSNVTHLFQEKFDVDGTAQILFEKYYNDPKSKYHGMTPEEIKKSWKDISGFACSHGTTRHLWAEGAFYAMTRQYDLIPDEFKCRLKTDENGNDYYEAVYAKEVSAAKYWGDMPKCVVPILAETKVYDTDLKYSGTFDLTSWYSARLDGKDNSLSGLLVQDWKSNRDLYKNFNGKKLLKPFDELLDMPLSLYKLQLSAYQSCIDKIGIKTVGRRIIWMLPTGDYEKIRVEHYVPVLRDALTKIIKENNGKYPSH